MRPSGPIIDLGKRTGPLLFFGGVYGNLQALQALKELAEKRGLGPDQIFFTGDIAGYCAQPVDCMELLHHWGVRGIAGNVELQLRSGGDDCGCNFGEAGRCDLLSRNWYAYSRAQMTPFAARWMEGLPHHIRLSLEGFQIFLVHGHLEQTAAYVFRSTSWPVKGAQLEAAGADVIIAGHTGLPFAQKGKEGWWINAGVIGMPANDGTDRVWCAQLEILDGKPDVTFLPFHYDHSGAAKIMLERGLPPSYAATLGSGIWDNCEILPEEETSEQGTALSAESLVQEPYEPV